MTYAEAQELLCRKLDIDFDNIALNGLFDLEDIKNYLNTASQKAWDYRFWDFTEKVKTTVLDSTMVSNGYLAYPTTLAIGTGFFLRINSVEQKKMIFQDFLKTFEDASGSTSKVWAEYGRVVFFNPNNAAVADVVDMGGKGNFVPLSADADLMPFSMSIAAATVAGNDAIITLAYAEALSSEKKRNPQQGALEEARAQKTLDGLWLQQKEGRAIEQSSRPMFDAPDFFRGGAGRGNNPAGTFNW